jgi:hypothetical protein
MTKDFRFVVTLTDCHDHIMRGDVKTKMETLLQAFTKKHCVSVKVSRYNPSSEQRKGKAMQKLAQDVLNNKVNKGGK